MADATLTWLECSTLAEAEAVDAVAEIFSRFGQGVAIEEPIRSSPDGELVERLTGQPVLVKTYLPSDERLEERDDPPRVVPLHLRDEGRDDVVPGEHPLAAASHAVQLAQPAPGAEYCAKAQNS